MNNFQIKHFRDYHEIKSNPPTKALEIGCFPVKEFGCCRYFGLFYTGRRPAIQKVIDKLKQKVTFGPFANRLGEDIGIDEAFLIAEVRNAFGLKEL